MATASTKLGNQYEIEVKDHLEATGWSVFRQHRKPMFMKGRMITVGADIYGCDLVCKKQGEKPLWIQVSTLDNKSKKEHQVLKDNPWNLQYETLQVWCRLPKKKEYRIFEAKEVECTDGGTEYCFVEREQVRVIPKGSKATGTASASA